MNEQLITEGQSFYWILLSLPIALLLFVFFKYYLIPEWKAKKEQLKPYTAEELESLFDQDFLMNKINIQSCRSITSLDKLSREVYKFQRDYMYVFDQERVNEKVDELVMLWCCKEDELLANSPAVVT